MAYNTDNGRVNKKDCAMTTETTYIWDPLSDSYLMEKDENGDTTAVYTVEPEPYGRVISQRRDEESSYYNYDALGSTRQLTDEAGDVTDTNLYDAWGVDVASTGTTENPFRWVGELEYRDAYQQHFYVRERTYDSVCASWISVDPIAFSDSFAPYAYAHLSPVYTTDASGMLCDPCPVRNTRLVSMNPRGGNTTLDLGIAIQSVFNPPVLLEQCGRNFWGIYWGKPIANPSRTGS